MKAVTNDNFETEVLKSQKPVLLEFYSDGCIPCKRMSPILAEIDEEYDSINVSKLNIKFGIDIAKEYSIMASPTFLFIKDGSEVKRIRGVVKKSELESAIKEVLL